MVAKKGSLKQVLENFLICPQLSVGASKLLLQSVRMLALEGQAESLVPNELPLDEIVKRASRLAARRNPDRPLDQVRNKDVLWKQLFLPLEAASHGWTKMGRRGHRTRFTFGPSTTCEQLRRMFDGLGIHQPSLDKVDVPQREYSSVSPDLPEQAPGQSLDRDGVVAILKKHEEDLHQLGLTALSLFGSVARNEARPDSDVDLLATFAGPITSDGFFAAKFFLEDLLGRRVDLLTEAALRDRVRSGIEAELVRVA
jgi:predicted nucleotidyltransferase